MFGDKAPFACSFEFPLERSSRRINRVEVAVVAQEIDEAIRDRWTGCDSPICFELPFLRACLQIHSIQTVIIAAEINGVPSDGRRRQDLRPGVELPFHLVQCSCAWRSVNAGVRGIGAKCCGILRLGDRTQQQQGSSEETVHVMDSPLPQ
jgi:hypothetical protein